MTVKNSQRTTYKSDFHIFENLFITDGRAKLMRFL